jgi:hypothetical protein
MRAALASLGALAAFAWTAVPAVADDPPERAPIEGSWFFSGGEILVERTGPSTYKGTTIAETHFSDCPHKPGEVTWQIQGDPKGFAYTGTHSGFVDGVENGVEYRCRQRTHQATWEVMNSATVEQPVYKVKFCDAEVGCNVLDESPRKDEDQDGLPDLWEQHGVYVDGKLLPLDKMGAKVGQRDLFVELDAASGFALRNASIEAVQDAFLDHDIDLHVDNGPASLMDPKTGASWGALSRATVDLAVPARLGSFSGTGDQERYAWGPFDAVKGAAFDKSRVPAFRYALSVNSIDAQGTSGVTRDLPASDFIVSLGTRRTIAGQAGTFMHELGHALGLHHNGLDDRNYNPTYLSVMNYSFQVGWVPQPGGAPEKLDYAESGLEIGPLDEAALSERLGLPGHRGLWSVRYCGNPETTAPRVIRVGQAVDWNCDHTIAPRSVNYDVNQDHAISTLGGSPDWPALIFRGGAIGAFGLARSLPATTPIVDTVPAEHLRKISAAIAGDAVAPTVKTVVAERTAVDRRLRRRRLRITATDRSGIDEIELRVDGSARHKFAKRSGHRVFATVLVVNKRGGSRVSVVAVDALGNRSKAIRRTVLLATAKTIKGRL